VHKYDVRTIYLDYKFNFWLCNTFTPQIKGIAWATSGQPLYRCWCWDQLWGLISTHKSHMHDLTSRRMVFRYPTSWETLGYGGNWCYSVLIKCFHTFLSLVPCIQWRRQCPGIKPFCPTIWGSCPRCELNPCTVIISTIVTTYPASTSRQPEPGEQKCVYPRGFPYELCHSWVAINRGEIAWL